MQTDTLNVKKLIHDAVVDKIIPGANLLIFKDGEEVVYCDSGWADIENSIPIKRNTIFRLYSMTKPITGFAVMLLLQRGDLDLFEPVSKYLNSFSSQRVFSIDGSEKAKREVKVIDLLRMTSGLSYPDPETEAGRQSGEVFDELQKRSDAEHPMNTIEFANRLGACDLAFHPGEHYLYGTSADVLGAVIEVCSRRKLSAFLQEEIFEPLRMKDTGFYVSKKKASRLANVYEETPEGLKEYNIPALGINVEIQPTFESGGAGLASTIDDYMTFAQMLLNGGVYKGKRLLSAKSADYFTSSQISGSILEEFQIMWDGGLSGFGYGNFNRVMLDPKRAVTLGTLGEYGWDGALGAYFCNSPKDRLSFVFLTQRANSGTISLTRRIRNNIFSSL
jgi:CubicO group peptidase (beta-lactamase class C family)